MLYNPLDPHRALFNLISMAYGISTACAANPSAYTDATSYLNITHAQVNELNEQSNTLPIVFPVEAKITSINYWHYNLDPSIIPLLKEYYSCRLIKVNIELNTEVITLPVGFLLHPNKKYEKQTDIPLYLVFDGTLDNIDLSSTQTLISDETLFGNTDIKVDKGLLKITRPVLAEVTSLLATYSQNRLIVAGHCYGAAIATLTSLALKKSNAYDQNINLWTLAAPAIGNKAFVKELTAHIKHIDSYHIYGDPVKTIPNSWFSDYVHHPSIDLSPYFDDDRWTDEFDKHHVNSIQTGYCALNQIQMQPLITVTNRYHRKTTGTNNPL